MQVCSLRGRTRRGGVAPPEVICAYPLSPQTHIAEALGEPASIRATVMLKTFMEMRHPTASKKTACYTQFSRISGASIRA